LRPPDVIYVPTPNEVVDKMLEMADVRKGEVVYDLRLRRRPHSRACRPEVRRPHLRLGHQPRPRQGFAAQCGENNVKQLVTITLGDISSWI